jgi:peptide chain release factor 3
MNWPIGDGEGFQGVLDRATKKVHLFQRGDRRKKVTANVVDLDAPELREEIGEELFEKLLSDIEMLDGLTSPPDIDRIQAGEQSPLFFGSAMTNFGVELFLKTFLEYARKPAGREAKFQLPGAAADQEPESEVVSPDNEDFSGFVFKLQANLDPRHR